MSIFLKPIQRRNPKDLEAEPKWYPVQCTTELVDEKKVAEMMTDETTLNRMEAQMAIHQLGKVVLRTLLDGKSVRLGEWGSFNITLNTEGVEDPSALSARNIKQVNINFTPSQEFRESLQKAEFIWLDKMVGSNTPATDDSGEEPAPEA